MVLPTSVKPGWILINIQCMITERECRQRRPFSPFCLSRLTFGLITTRQSRFAMMTNSTIRTFTSNKPRHIQSTIDTWWVVRYFCRLGSIIDKTGLRIQHPRPCAHSRSLRGSGFRECLGLQEASSGKSNKRQRVELPPGAFGCYDSQ